MRLLDAGLQAALGGDGQVVLVAGEPGVGKSRLAEEVADHARDLGVVVGWGRVSDDDGSPPYWPFRQVARALDGELALLSPERGGTVADGLAGGEQRFRLFEAVTDFLVAAAEPNGLLVVLDDLQWADPASLQLLTHLALGIRQARLMLLGTFRDTETAHQQALRVVLAGLAGEPVMTRLRLVGLAEQEVAAQLAEVTGWAVSHSVAAAVCRRTRGNPFFVGELGRLLADSPEGGREELPDGVRDAVRGRLARLSSRCRAVVSAGAVLGSKLDPAAIAWSAGRELTEVLDGLDEASAAGIVTGGRFVHDLIREAARLEVPTVERLALHQRMAEYLAGLGDADTRVAEVAMHWLESLPAGDVTQAVSWTQRAADQAMAHLAWEEADALYGRAVAAATDQRFTSAQRCRLLLGRSRAQIRAYDVDGARQSLLMAADIARRACDVDAIAQAALTMEGVTDFLWDSVGRALCEEALNAMPEEDSAVRARLLALSVVADTWHPSAEDGARSAAALAMAERVGDRRAIVEALRARQMVRSGPDGAADRLALADRLLALGTDHDDDATMWGLLWRFDALAQLGDIDQAEAELEPIGAIAERLRSPLAGLHNLRSRAAIALARGRFSDAEEFNRQADILARRAGDQGAQAASLAFLMVVAGMTGNGEFVDDSMFESRMAQVAPLRPLVAGLKLGLGQRTHAHRIYRTLPPPGAVPGFILLPVLAYTAELAAEFDDLDTAAAIYRQLLPFADLVVVGGAGATAIQGSARLPLGRAAAAMGRLDDAVRHLRAAIKINQRAGMPPHTTTACYQLAKVLAKRRRPGDREEAAALAVSAAAVAGELGMATLRRDAEQLAASLAGQATGPLTRREQEITVLVAQGLTNRQIAATLHISDRTAETHVQHILGKLGFTNRTQIAAWVAADQQKMSTGDT